VECRDALGDFGQVAAQMLPTFTSERLPLTAPLGMTARFVARAHSEGIPLNTMKPGDGSNRSRFLRPAAAYAAAASFATLILAFALTLQNGRIRQWVSSLTVSATVRHAPPNADRADGGFLRRTFEQKVDTLQKQLSQLTAELKSAQGALESARSENLQTKSGFTDAQKANAELRHGMAARDLELAQLSSQADQMNAELDRLGSAKAIAELEMRADRSELNDLRAKLASLNEELNESRQLSAAANQAKELIIARNLHIVDVDDTDGTGRRQRSFGRIFYSEGTNLVFYAYDLSDPRKLNTKINFYAWGGREGIAKPVRSLGIFRSDDEAAGRWVLKFDDPKVLAEINCVFVTAESAKKAVTQPSGRQILFASLGKANHP